MVEIVKASSKAIEKVVKEDKGAGMKEVLVDKVTQTITGSSVGAPAKVMYHAGITQPTGDYASVRFDVSLEMPCNPLPDAINKTFEVIEDWVDKRLQQLIEAQFPDEYDE